jgi:hypothetical protein
MDMKAFLAQGYLRRAIDEYMDVGMDLFELRPSKSDLLSSLLVGLISIYGGEMTTQLSPHKSNTCGPLIERMPCLSEKE